MGSGRVLGRKGGCGYRNVGGGRITIGGRAPGGDKSEEVESIGGVLIDNVLPPLVFVTPR